MSVAALDGIRVLDVSTLFAGPMAATFLSDFGAEVIKVEHPQGDPVRHHGATVNGVGLWGKIVGRNKRALTLNLNKPEAQDVMRQLVADTDVLIENFRPGTFERWGLGYDELSRINPGLVLLRVTGFGQFGPYSSRPGFGTLAEAMSGFAAITGEPDGPPTLPPFGLADGISALTAAFAALTALRAREKTGRGQVVDLAIIEPILTLVGPQPTIFDATGNLQPRTGNRSVNNAPRNTYKTLDSKWVAISTSSNSIAERVMKLVGRPEFVDEPWFFSGSERARHADELDSAVSEWVGRHDRDDVIDQFEKAEAAIAPIFDASDIVNDPQFQALNTLVRVPDEELGSVLMQNVLFRLSDTPGEVRTAGPALGRHTDEILAELGINEASRDALRTAGAV